jgi:hypothetical protein
MKSLFRGNSYGQILTPFCPSALNHQATILCGHPYQKTVSTLARNITWLIGSFHLNLPLGNYFSGNELLNTASIICQCFYYVSVGHIRIDLP